MLERMSISFGTFDNAIGECFKLINRHFSSEVDQTDTLETAQCITDWKRLRDEARADSGRAVESARACDDGRDLQRSSARVHP
jgi:hypothetical protein